MDSVQEIMAYDEAIYMDLDKSGSTPNYELVNVGTTKFDESSNPTEKSTQYIGQKVKINSVTGYDVVFAMENELIKNEKVIEDMEEIFDKQLTGEKAKRNVVVAKLWKPVEGSANTYEAKKVRVSCVITDKTRTAGETIKLNGSLKGASEVVYGKFNTSTKTFTPNED